MIIHDDLATASRCHAAMRACLSASRPHIIGAFAFRCRTLALQASAEIFGDLLRPRGGRGSRHVCAHHGDWFAVSTRWPQSAGARHVGLPETSIQARRIRPVSSAGHGFPLGASGKIRKSVWLTMAVTVPQPEPDLNTHGPDLQKRAAYVCVRGT